MAKKKLSKIDKVKKVTKYVMNIMAIVGALITGINAIDGITIPYAIQIVQIIGVFEGVLGGYLTGDKIYNKVQSK